MNKIIKRLLDIAISIGGIICLFPIWLPVVVLLKCTGDREIFFFQERIGFGNLPFKIWKFATMSDKQSSKQPGSLTVRNDPRVTPVGKILRSTKLNELPQIVNILKGEMSIVGPRPQMKRDFDPYTEEVKEKLATVKPGITGIASIVFRDEEKLLSETKLDVQDCYNLVIAPYKGEIEKWYVNHVSIWTDIQIILITVRAIFKPNSQLVFKIFRDLPKQDLLAEMKRVERKVAAQSRPYIEVEEPVA